MSNHQCIKSVELIHQNSLQVNFSHNWYQEDISDLATSIIDTLKTVLIIEKTTGADREYYRLQWQDEYFYLNFEYYSQSCWIEHEITPKISLLTHMQQQLSPATVNCE